VALVERVVRKVDRAAVKRAEQEEIARTNAERREFLYDQLFRNVSPGRDVLSLLTESTAQELFARALYVDVQQQIAILQVAVDHRWSSIVTAFIKHWAGDPQHPIADTVQELWNLTTTRSAG
jgi:hypothetical protein